MASPEGRPLPHSSGTLDEPALPSGWRMYVTPEGNRYYHNHVHGITQWEEPQAQGATPAAAQEAPAAVGGAAQAAAVTSAAAAWANYVPGGASCAATASSYRPPVPFPGRHVPCLLTEAVQELLPPAAPRDGIYCDGTFGRGGHTREILKSLGPGGRLFAFDVDPEAVQEARRLEQEDSRFRILHRPFGDLAIAMRELGHGGAVNGVLLDLGVSSPQLDDRHRGFSVTQDAPLDLRMNQTQGTPAAEWLRDVSVEELAWVIHSYGEDQGGLLVSERIAQAIKDDIQRRGPGISTRRLAQVVIDAKGHGSRRDTHPAKLTFQAIRIFLNQEFEQLDKALHGAFDVLAMKGRCVVISFKAKEANAIRDFAREHEDLPYSLPTLKVERLCELYPLLATSKPFAAKMVTEIWASSGEVVMNSRSRSSQLHVLQKVGRRSPILPDPPLPRPAASRFCAPCRRPLFVGATEEGPALAAGAGPAAALQPGSTGGSSSAALPEARHGPVPNGCTVVDTGKEQAPGADGTGGVSGGTGSTDPPPVWACPSEATGDATGSSPLKQAEVGDVGLGAINGGRVDQVGVVHEFFSVNSGGYLDLRPGEKVHVLFDGTEGEEAGWSYGTIVASVPRAEGWFPTSAVKRREDAEVL